MDFSSETDYNLALSRIEQLMGVRSGTPEGDELNNLVNLVEAYEKRLLTSGYESVE
jgi:HTH-type transcriptional regulator/antitoxin HigA